MLKPSNIIQQILYAWVPAYLVLMIHGSTLTQIDDFLLIFVFSPLAMGVALAIIYIRLGDREREVIDLFEQISIPAKKHILVGIVLYILFPLSLVFSSMLYAQYSQGYSGANIGIVVWFGGITTKEILESLYRRYFNST